MVGDASFRNCVAALWALVGAVRDRGCAHIGGLAAAAVEALAKARGSESYVLLHEQDGAIHVNGRRLQLGVDVFTAAQGLANLLRSRGVGELLFDAVVDADALVAWARCWTLAETSRGDPEQELDRHGAIGIHASGREMTLAPVLSLRGQSARPDSSDSRLRSVFLQHQLIAAIPAHGLVPPHLAKVVVQAVVDRLLGLAGGLDPLMLLQRDKGLLHRGLQVAVLTVVVARAAGWPEDRLVDLGAAALLHDVGAMLDPRHPGTAGFIWLIERGGDDFWLRSAIVARTWREAHGGSVREVAANDCGVAAFVRLGSEIERLSRHGPIPGDGLEAALGQCATAGAFPQEFVEVAVEAFAAMAG